MNFIIEVETNGRWIVEIVNIPGMMAYCNTREEVNAKVQALAIRVEADKLEQGGTF